MNSKEYRKIKEHFDNISNEEFRQNLIDCGYYKIEFFSDILSKYGLYPKHCTSFPILKRSNNKLRKIVEKTKEKYWKYKMDEMYDLITKENHNVDKKLKGSIQDNIDTINKAAEFLRMKMSVIMNKDEIKEELLERLNFLKERKKEINDDKNLKIINRIIEKIKRKLRKVCKISNDPLTNKEIKYGLKVADRINKNKKGIK